jgi:hypothetical protein
MRFTVNDLTADYVRQILDYDPETGHFRWKARADVRKEWNTRRAGKIAGAPCGPHGYWQIRINDRLYLGHRLAWLFIHGEWPAGDLDHRNLRTGDNALCNLRAATASENGQNRALQRNNKSGFKGVSFDKQTGRWRASIKAHGIVTRLGRFDTPEKAGAAYAAAASQLYGEFARVEKPVSDEIAIRLANDAESARKAQSNNLSGFRGVSEWGKNGRRWQARINVAGKRFKIGVYDSPEEAAAAYADTARRLFGEFARVEGRGADHAPPANG